ncbi:MAG: radical SAM protein [Thermodesulfovibrionales bacterium]|nr:radical SAM protein [Thermodesulfovibrionales bacterium]
MEWLRKYVEKIKVRRRPFIAFQIEPTSRCQLKCIMCPRTVFSEEWENGDMPLSVYERISRHFYLVDNVHLQGWGEPLLHPNIFDMIQIAKEKHCKVSLTTNGFLLDSNVSTMLIKEGVDIVAISIAGASKDTHEKIRKGSNFDHLLHNIKALNNFKHKMKSKNPKLVLSFLMTKTNIEDLPEIVNLAKEIGIDEIVATNLDYTPTQLQDDLKAFSCDADDNSFKKFIEITIQHAKKIKLPLRIYPLEMEEVVMCEMNPLKIVFISQDGSVSPCVYLNMTKQGPISRIFCGKQYEIERQCFGNIGEYDFMEIWEQEDYKNFRRLYSKRLSINRKIFDFIEDFRNRNEAMDEFEKRLETMLSENPLPSVCNTCYKAYNI